MKTPKNLADVILLYQLDLYILPKLLIAISIPNQVGRYKTLVFVYSKSYYEDYMC